MRGIIEGFYGTPWSWEERRLICAELAAAGMDTYVYAPKDDPLHRAQWRDPYPASEMDAFASLVESGTLRVGFAISPGLSMDLEDPADRRALLAKIERMTSVGISTFGLLLDDLDPAPGLGARHGALTAWLRDELDPEVSLFMVPLHYTGTGAVPYLEQLAAAVPEDVPIAWTGQAVVNERITASDARAWSAAMGGRRPLLWDNTPVNDALMVDHLFTGPLRGREPDLVDEISGYLANPMVQARASLPPLLSAAAWLRGEDAEAAWRDALGAERVLFEGCDGSVPGAMLDSCGLDGDQLDHDALARLEEWFADAERCDAGSLGDAVGPWVDQLRREAAVGRVAVQALRAEPGQAATIALLLHAMWPPVTTSRIQVLGGRGALLPAFAQDRDSRWVATAASYVAPASVVDRLVRAVFERLG